MQLHIKSYFILALLFASTVMYAQLHHDSLMFYTLPAITHPKIYSTDKTNNTDSTLGFHSLPDKLMDMRDVHPKHIIFYNNLQVLAQRQFITRWVHELITKEPAIVELTGKQPQRSENPFAYYKGKTIRNINIGTTSTHTPGIDAPYYYSPVGRKKVDKFLHFNTNQRVIKNNLLFKPGDKLDPFQMADSERILRELSYLENARIYVFEDILNPELVDIVVITKDRWSRGIDMDLTEIDKGKVELYDKNIFGLGHKLQTNLLFDGKEDRLFGYQADLNIYNISGNFLTTKINYLDAFENNIFHIRSGRNFLTPSIKYAGGIEFTSACLVDDFNFPDTLFTSQKLNYHEYDYWFGRSFLFPARENEAYLRNNIYITSRFNRSIFFERPDTDKNIRYDYHNRNLFLLNLSFTRLGFLKSSYIYGFGPTEDIPIGSKFETSLGYEDNQFFPRWYAGIDITHSNYLNNIAYLKNRISLGGFINDGVSEQGVFHFQSSGFTNLIGLNNFFLRQFITLNFTKGINRFDDELISISNHRGIRGLRSDNLAGTQKFTIQTETMLYAKNHWYGFRYALYSMADLGWIGPGDKIIMKESFYSGFGIGMRIRNEHLVLPTLQFRFAWFPRVPESASTKLFYIMTERKHVFDDYRITAPDILPYR